MKNIPKFRYRIKQGDGKIATWIINLKQLEEGLFDFTGAKILTRDKFSGEKDKKGGDLFEGDIITFEVNDIVSRTKTIATGRVGFFRGGFAVTQSPIGNEPFTDETYWLCNAIEGVGLLRLAATDEKENTVEKIGDIYENPELIK